ncbi:hypothetical protein AO073_01560 [Pseudomonas syringae ICMP 11293]|nr:hypothetical protein AO073_01560 [Pseudomonas syringae ICMP 11293]
MIHPSIMEKTLPPFKMKEYRSRHAMNEADFLYTHATDCKLNSPRSKGKQMDGFRFIISCKPEELSHCNTDKEKADFLKTLGRAFLQNMSGSEEINFYYKMVPHLKDGNPHLHIMMSSYTIDGQYYPFFRGKQDHGLIKLFDDVKYDLEKKHPTLLRMEHDKREKNRLKIEVDKETNVVTGEHAEIFNNLNKILSSHEGSNYSHPKIVKELTEAGFELRYTKAKSKSKFKDIQIFHKDAGEAFRSYANLPFQAKRVMENYETYQYFAKALKIKSDVSATVAKATLLVNSFPSKDVTELNKVLYEELGVMLMPSFKTNVTNDGGTVSQSKTVSSWSFYLARENVKFPALKAGVNDPKKLITTLPLAEELHEQIEKMIHYATVAQEAAGIRYSQKKRENNPLFRFLENEKNAEFLERMLASKAYKQSLTSQMASGNSFISSYNSRKMLETNGTDSVTVYQANMSSAKSAIQWYVAQGFASIVFKGTENPEIQRMMYIQGILHDVKIDNYTPSAELKAEAQALLDGERDKVIESNKEKIKAHLADIAENPNGEKEHLYLRTNRKLDVDVDERPKLYGFLYGIKMGLDRSVFMHMDKLNLDKEQIKEVIKHFASEEKINSVELRDILIRAGILDDVEPVTKERQKPVKTPSQSSPASSTVSQSAVKKPATKSSAAKSSAAGDPKPSANNLAKAGTDTNSRLKP